MNKRTIIEDTVTDLVMGFVCYDRKDDEELSEEELIQAIKDGLISIEEISELFENRLESWWRE